MSYPFQLPELPYAYNALEPHIDELTMTTHHSKHHNGYTNKFNAFLEGQAALQNDSVEDLLKLAGSHDAIRNNGGGYYNHKLFWEVMSPVGGGVPTGDLATAINDTFGSFDDFKAAFAAAATGVFGSGWAWLAVNAEGKLYICGTSNQENPLMDVAQQPGTPILGIDVWEHAYYLKYKNLRGDYVKAFFNVVNWDAVAAKYKAAMS